jgi:hypothetical protein
MDRSSGWLLQHPGLWLSPLFMGCLGPDQKLGQGARRFPSRDNVSAFHKMLSKKYAEQPSENRCGDYVAARRFELSKR